MSCDGLCHLIPNDLKTVKNIMESGCGQSAGVRSGLRIRVVVVVVVVVVVGVSALFDG